MRAEELDLDESGGIENAAAGIHKRGSTDRRGGIFMADNILHNGFFVIRDLENLRAEIRSGKFHAASGKNQWGGAGLIVESQKTPNRGRVGDVYVISRYAPEISVLLNRLKVICAPCIDFMSKLDFYPALGQAALSYITVKGDDLGVLDHMVLTAENYVMENQAACSNG